MAVDAGAWLPSRGVVEMCAAGVVWDAVRVPCGAGLSVVKRLGVDCGAVIDDRYGRILYFLVWPGAADAWDLARLGGAGVRGAATFVAVPPVEHTGAERMVRWLVPPVPGRCLTDAVLLRDALAAEATAGGAPQT